MGICSSCESPNSCANTAKLISIDGTLHEFSFPVKVSYVLQRNPECFICNSDEMDFNEAVSPVSGDDELQMGRLYFALPLSRLRRRMSPEEMAALAVKATNALGCKKCGCRRSKLVFPADDAAAGGGGGSSRRG